MDAASGSDLALQSSASPYLDATLLHDRPLFDLCISHSLPSSGSRPLVRCSGSRLLCRVPPVVLFP